MNQRPFQHEFESLISKDPLQYRYALAFVTPGGGKSYLPAILATRLIPSFCNRIAWIVPRINLAHAADKVMAQHGIAFMRGTGAPDPSRKTQGFVCTYQAIASNPELYRQEFERFQYALVLDEPHHLGDQATWRAHVEPLVALAKFRLFMSGTLERHDNNRIAFIDYDTTGRPVITSGEGRLCIRYTRKEALVDEAIVPIEFPLIDANVSYVRNGERRDRSLTTENGEDDARDALFTALKTGFADELLTKAINNWLIRRDEQPGKWPQLLIVADSQENARRLKRKAEELCSGRAIVGGLAISDDEDSVPTVRKFCDGKLHFLSTCQMAYEGMDAPAVTHIACLTHIRSKPWLEQMIARAVRRYPGKTCAWVYCPDDALLRRVIEEIRQDQLEAVEEKKTTGIRQGDVDRPPFDPRVAPLASDATHTRLEGLDSEVALTKGNVAWMKRKGFLIEDGAIVQRVFAAIGSSIPEVEEDYQAPLVTPSDEAEKLRADLQRACSSRDREHGFEYGETNRMVKMRFRVSRTDMDLAQLREAHAYVSSLCR